MLCWFNSNCPSQFMKKRKYHKPLADELKELYDEFIRNGFSTDQSFQLLLELVKKKKVK